MRNPLLLTLAHLTLLGSLAAQDELISRAGNAESEKVRLAALNELAESPAATPQLQAEAKALAEMAAKWDGGSLKFYGAAMRGKKPKEILNYEFHVAQDSPLYPLTRLYLGRMMAWTLIENSTIRTDPTMGPWYHQEATKAFQAYEKAFPQNPIAGMYQGRAIPWPKELKSFEGAPEWAVLQREQLHRLTDIIHWWIDHRQKEDGQFGGGWGDDCEMWRWWSSVLLGFEDPKIRDAQLKFSRAGLNRPHLKGGFMDQITDVEHAAEDTTDNLIPLMVLEPENAKWRDWGTKLVPFMENVWTGPNARGERQFKSFYFSATETAKQPQRAFDVIANVGALHPALLTWQRTRDEKLGKPICEWLDTWVAATAREENGKPAGILPASLRWPDGVATGAAGNWWEPIAPGGYMYSYYIWPSVLTEMTDAMALAYTITKEERYLEPVRSMAAIRLKHLRNPPASPGKTGSEAWCAEQLAPRANANSNIGGIVKTAARLKALTGTKEFDELLSLEGGEFVVGAREEDVQAITDALWDSAEALRVNFPGFTSEVRSTDRVMRFIQFQARDYKFDEYLGVNMPKHELLYRMVTGDKNSPRFPQPAVQWLTLPRDLAVMVTQANTKTLEATLVSFRAQEVEVPALLRLLDAGEYQVSLIVKEKETKLPSLQVKPGVPVRVTATIPPNQVVTLRVRE